MKELNRLRIHAGDADELVICKGKPGDYLEQIRYS